MPAPTHTPQTTDKNQRAEHSPNFVMSGWRAFGQVRAAAQATAERQKEYKELASQFAAVQSELDHRTQIAQNHDSIVANKTQELTQATTSREAASVTYQTQESQHSQLAAQLEALKQENQQKLAPYKSLADTAQERLDDAAQALSAARRAARAADAALADTKTHMHERQSVAEQAIKNSEARLARLEQQKSELATNPEATKEAKAEVERSLETERGRLVKAKSDLAQAREQGERACEEAEATQKAQASALQNAEAAHKEAKAAAAEQKAKYDERFKAAQANEHALDTKVREKAAEMRDTNDRISALTRKIDEAKAAIEEAKDIVATPEVTEQLRQQHLILNADVAQAKTALSEQQRAEKRLRATTKASRVRLIVFGVLVLIVLVAVILWVVGLLPVPTPQQLLGL